MGPLPDIGPALGMLVVLAAAGGIAICGGLLFVLWWVLTHVTVGIA